MKKILFVLVCALTLMGDLAFGETVKGDVTFEAASTTGIMKINGTGAKVTGQVDAVKGGKLEVDLTAFTTSNDMRDGHMKDKYLEVKKYPKATLVIDGPVVTSANEFKWTGKLTLKGVTKPVQGVGKLSGEDLWATFTVSLADYNVGVPEWLGVTVAKDVTIDVNAKATK